MVAAGLVTQFMFHLVGFISKRKSEMKKTFQKWFPPLLMLVMALVVFWPVAAAEGQGFCLQRIWEIAGGFQRPVEADGFARAQFAFANPRDTDARSRAVERAGTKNQKIISATEWLANVMMNPQVADAWPVFRVDNPDLITFLKLPEKNAAQQQDGKHYSWNQIAPSFDLLNKENERVQKIESPAAHRLRTRRRQGASNGWSFTRN